VGDAEDAVAAAAAAADDAADAYFAQLSRVELLDTDIVTTEEQLDELEAEAKRLRRNLRERAALAYLRSGNGSLEFGLGTEEQALETARRRTILNRLNESDNDLAGDLDDVTDSLQAKRGQLEADRAAQEEALGRLEAEQVALDAKLAEAQALRNEAVAKQQAEEAALAAAEAAAAAEATAEAEVEAEAATTPQSAPPPAPTEAAPTAVPAAPTPPASYSPTPGQHPRHNDPFLVCTRAIESGGNYQAVNSSGPYYGAYQFLQSTWNSAANHAGRYELIGVVPSQASPYDQDDMAWTVYQWQGKGPWGGRC
jgi:hypothetical protein